MRVINIRKLRLFLLVSNKERNKFAQKLKQNLHVYSSLSYNVLKEKDINRRDAYQLPKPLWASCNSQEHYQGDWKCCVPSAFSSVLLHCVLWSLPWRKSWFQFQFIQLLKNELLSSLKTQRCIFTWYSLRTFDYELQTLTTQFANTLCPKSLDFMATLRCKFVIMIAPIPTLQAHSLNNIRIIYQRCTNLDVLHKGQIK